MIIIFNIKAPKKNSFRHKITHTSILLTYKLIGLIFLTKNFIKNFRNLNENPIFAIIIKNYHILLITVSNIYFLKF